MVASMNWRRLLEPTVRPLFRVYSRLRRGMTLGVRGLVTDVQGRVLLIRHTYTSGWYMPGGGVERGETAEEALHRELQEEAGVRITGRAQLMSFHSNHVRFPGDQVLVYRITQWEACAATQVGEIEEVGWFSPDALPDDTTPSTRKRLKEALDGDDVYPHW